MEVRRLSATDRPQWEPLWQGYLTFYEHELDATTTDVTWSRLVGDDPALVGLVAEEGDELVGLCHLVLHHSTWSVGPYCYLEDLFVRPDVRLGGVGRALIGAAVVEAQHAGASKLYWQTHESNETASHLYDKVAEHRGFLVYEADVTG